MSLHKLKKLNEVSDFQFACDSDNLRELEILGYKVVDKFRFVVFDCAVQLGPHGEHFIVINLACLQRILALLLSELLILLEVFLLGLQALLQNGLLLLHFG